MMEDGVYYSKKEGKGLKKFTYHRLHIPSNHETEDTVYVLGTAADMLRLINHWNRVGAKKWKYWL